MHEYQILHRDIKPSNIFVRYINTNNTKDKMNLYLGDFDDSK